MESIVRIADYDDVSEYFLERAVLDPFELETQISKPSGIYPSLDNKGYEAIIDKVNTLGQVTTVLSINSLEIASWRQSRRLCGDQLLGRSQASSSRHITRPSTDRREVSKCSFAEMRPFQTTCKRLQKMGRTVASGYS